MAVQTEAERGTLLDPEYLRLKHEAGLPYHQYIATGTDQQQQDWRRIYDTAQLTDHQRNLVAGFTRRINVVGLSGTWCGDCVQQCPLIQRIAEVGPQAIDLRWLDRDEHDDLQQQVRINGGRRVPVLIVAAEDYALAEWFGDRVLARYRALAQQWLGAACPMPGAPLPQEEIDATLADWVSLFERLHLMLRLSPRLRERHGD